MTDSGTAISELSAVGPWVQGRPQMHVLELDHSPFVQEIFKDLPFEDDAGDFGEVLRCSSCLNRITGSEFRREVNGSYVHRCTNPVSIQFLIGCFVTAWGCQHIGQPTNEFSWFRGYRWRIVNCASCHEHLGWNFSSGEDSFYGLVLSKLIANDSNLSH